MLVLLLLAGAALRLWQYFANTSLWIDEIALAENVSHSPLGALLGEPLALDQVAPPGFLAALKGATALLGRSELAFRLFPLLCGLAALPLFACLARRVLPGWTAVLATALFALAPSLISYSAELKQYSTDVAAAVVLTLVALGLGEVPLSRRRLADAALIGTVAVWFSQPGVLLVAGLGAGLAWIAVRRGGWPVLRPLVPVLGLWAASAAAATVAGIHSLTPATRDYMRSFWQPSLPRPVVIVIVLFACAVFWKKRPGAAPLLVGPALVTLAAAAAHRYPFSGRAILFLTPVGLLAAADIVESLVEGLARLRVPRPASAAVLSVSLGAAAVLHLPVYRHEETRPVLAGVAARLRPGDVSLRLLRRREGRALLRAAGRDRPFRSDFRRLPPRATARVPEGARPVSRPPARLGRVRARRLEPGGAADHPRLPRAHRETGRGAARTSEPRPSSTT